MVAQVIHYYVVEIPADENVDTAKAPPLDACRHTREDLLPWADPYIRSLVEKVKAEIEEERAAAADARRHAELDEACGDAEFDFDESEFADPWTYRQPK